ncbi:MAG: hypothetical protein R3D00_12715 [Bacteroidia bacterium]
MNRIIKTFILTGLLLFVINGIISAQNQIYINRNYRPGQTEREQMVAQYYPFSSTVLDLSKFRERYPAYKNMVPEEVTIRPPDLTGLKDVVYSVSYLEVPGEAEGILLITLVANYFSDEPIHFFDFNLDKNFTNDRNSRYIFPEKTEVQSFTFTKTGNNFRQYTIDILNPEFQVSTDPELEIAQNKQEGEMALPSIDYANLEKSSSKNAIPRKKQLIFLQFKTVIGFGGISYSYTLPVTNYPSRYNVEFNSKGIGTELTFAFKQFRLGTTARVENLFYWTSKRYTQIQEPYTTCEKDRWGRLVCTNYDGVMEEINREIKPKNRYSVGLIGEYAFILTRRTDLVPYIEAGFMQYFNDQFVPNRSYPDVSYTFDMFQTYGGGLRLKHNVGNNGDIVISAGFEKMQFNPKGYFDGVENLQNGQYQTAFSLGYQFGIL